MSAGTGVARMAESVRRVTKEDNRYRPGCVGWVVRSTRAYTRKDGTEQSIVSWWYGPRGGWATYGPLDYSVHVFATKAEAQAAMRAEGLGRHDHVQRVIDAEVENAPRWRARWVDELASIGEPPTTRKGDKRLAAMLSAARDASDPRYPHELARWRRNYLRAVEVEAVTR